MVNKNIFVALTVLLLISMNTLALAQSTNSTASVPLYNPPSAGVTINASVVKFLTTYIQPSVVANSLGLPQTIGANHYLIINVNGTTNHQFLVNTTTSSYSFVLNQSSVFTIIKPYLIAAYYPLPTAFSALKSSVLNYENSSGGALLNCEQLVGLGRGYACTAKTNVTACLQNTCQTIPFCNKQVIGNFGSAVVGPIIENFSVSVTALNNSYKSYFSTLSSINQQNVASGLINLQSSLAAINTNSTAISQGSLFPVPSNISIAEQQAVCPQYVVGTGPWWCNHVAICLGTTFNTTLINNTQNELNTLIALPISDTSISAIAAGDVATGQSYFLPVFSQTQQGKFNVMLNATLPKYNSIIANLTFISAHYQNTSLQGVLALLTSTFNSVEVAGAMQNLTQANATLNAALSNALVQYSYSAPKYFNVYKLAVNSTGDILVAELNYKGNVPYNIAQLSAQQASINEQLDGSNNATQLAALSTKITAISAQAKSLSAPLSFGAVIKYFDSGILASLLYTSNAPISSKLSATPLYAALIALVIDVIILVLIYELTYARLKRKQKIKFSPQVRRAWSVIFIVLSLLIVMHVVLTFIYAAGANNFLPMSGFTSAVHSNKIVFIGINSSIYTSNAVNLCVSLLKSTLQGQGKTVYTMSLVQSYSCTLPTNASVQGTSCYNKILASKTPLIIVNQGSNSSLVYNGLFGNILYASGAAASGASCQLNAIFKQ